MSQTKSDGANQETVASGEKAGNNKMNIGSSVEVHSVLTVVSSTPVDPPGRNCPLNPLDRAMAQHTLHVIFYYGSGSLDFNSIRPALNEVLTLYPNVTGRLAKDSDGNWGIKCTDAGVRVYRAKVGTSVDEWLRSAAADDEMHLTAWDDLPHDPQFWSPFRIQVTDFEGGGTAIALSCLHMLADPVSATSLIKSWTDIHHGVVITHPPFLHPQALDNEPKTTRSSNSIPYYAAKFNGSDPGPSLRMASTTFRFSDAVIKRSLSEFCSALPDATPFDLLTALFWTGIVKLRTTTNQSRKISVCLDMRERLRAPLPYFGNAFHFVEITLDDSQDSVNPSHVAELVHHRVAGVKEEEIWSAVDWFRSKKDDQGKFASPCRMYGPELTFVNMEHMIAPASTGTKESEALMYMARFANNQKPVHVSYQIGNVDGEGLIFVMPSSDGGLARTVSVTLPEEDMRKLLQDEVIKSLDPTLLLTGRG